MNKTLNQSIQKIVIIIIYLLFISINILILPFIFIIFGLGGVWRNFLFLKDVLFRRMFKFDNIK